MRSKTIVERIRDLIDRFPEDEQAIRDLINWEPTFDALCEEYRRAADELLCLRQEGNSNTAFDVEKLQTRCASLKEEVRMREEAILARIGG